MHDIVDSSKAKSFINSISHERKKGLTITHQEKIKEEYPFPSLVPYRL